MVLILIRLFFLLDSRQILGFMERFWNSSRKRGYCSRDAQVEEKCTSHFQHPGNNVALDLKAKKHTNPFILDCNLLKYLSGELGPFQPHNPKTSHMLA